MVSEIGDRAKGVGESKLLQRTAEEIQRVKEKEIAYSRSVQIESAQSWRTKVSQHCILRGIPFCEVEILKVMRISFRQNRKWKP